MVRSFLPRHVGLIPDGNRRWAQERGLSKEAAERIVKYFKIEADISYEQKEELIQMAQKYSPVFNTIAKSAPVAVLLDK